MGKVVVIGSMGNVGQPLVKELRKRGEEVLEFDITPGFRPSYHVADINNPIDLLPILDFKPDRIFFLAAMVSRVTCEQASSLCVSTNLGGLNNAMVIAKKVGAMFVYFSTSEVYGPDLAIMDENDANPNPNNRYGLTKLLGEKLVEYEVKHHGLHAVTLRPFMMYDENEDLGDHRSAMIRFAYNLSCGLPIEVHEGSERAWLHVSDAVDAIIAAGNVREYHRINIASKDFRSIAELAEQVRKELDAPANLIKLIQLPKQMTLKKRPTTEKMEKLLGVVPKVSFEDGVKAVCMRVKQLGKR